MKIENFTEKDLPFISTLKNECCGDIVKPHQLYLKLSFCYPFKIMLKNRIVAVGTVMVFSDTAWLCHIIVSQEWRGQGIGHFMVKSLLEFVDKRFSSRTVSLIATESGYHLYKKEGFRVQSNYQMFTRNRSSFGPIALCHERRPFRVEDKEAVFALDRQMSGEDRSSLLDNMLGGAVVYVDDKIINGFYLPEAGEGLVCARTTEAAKALLSLKTTGQVQCVALPDENREGQILLKKLQFRKTFQVRRMIFGESFEWTPQMNFCRLSGYAG